MIAVCINMGARKSIFFCLHLSEWLALCVLCMCESVCLYFNPYVSKEHTCSASSLAGPEDKEPQQLHIY